MKNIKKEMEYDEAPSGYVTLYNYKEPFMRYDKGSGFLGVLLFDGKTDKVQCHLCGLWFTALGNHLHKEHNMTASAYKEEVGLNQTTALIGENLREKLIANGLEQRMKNLVKGHKWTKESREKVRATIKKNSFEMQNLHGTCPEQILSRITKKYNELGRTPTTDELGRSGFMKTIRKVYGSTEEAFRLAGVPYRKPGLTMRKPKITVEKAIDFVKTFLEKEKRLPKRKDFISANLRGLYDVNSQNKKIKFIYKEALKCRFVPVQEKIKFTDEDLLNFLKMFEKENCRKPSTSDGKRKLIPYPSKYIYRFGSWKNALKLAFPHDYISSNN